MLANLTRIKKNDRIIDLGTGCGVIPLVLAFRSKTDRKITGVEIQPELAGLAKKNVIQNNFGNQIEILEADFRQVPSLFAPESFDLAISNPPYRKAGTGRMNPDIQKAIARHEIAAKVDDVFAASANLLKDGGRIALIYPAERLAGLVRSALDFGFSPKRLTVIYSFPHGHSRLVHLECRKGGGEELRIEEPFYIYDSNGLYSEAMQKFYNE